MMLLDFNLVIKMVTVETLSFSSFIHGSKVITLVLAEIPTERSLKTKFRTIFGLDEFPHSLLSVFVFLFLFNTMGWDPLCAPLIILSLETILDLCSPSLQLH